ncbi:helix-turn-helix domain-containing protein [Clostridium botulinum]|uniref:helix-turn-helix domain-containing protein n=1 Tax=Clostridium botulinum TaxID=1491 RepID=UPI0007742B11|nr:helix-turn-helix domain-containing protein [Clostridium botulinum]
MDFGTLVKIKRKKENITLAELSEKTGISASFINRVENNTNNSPSANNVFGLAEELDISIPELAECFNSNLRREKKEEVKLLVSSDYVILKDIENILINIANNYNNYEEEFLKLIMKISKLKKENINLIYERSSDGLKIIVKMKIKDDFIIDKLIKILNRYFGLNNKYEIISGDVLDMSQKTKREETELREYVNEIYKYYGEENDECEELLKYLDSIGY